MAKFPNFCIGDFNKKIQIFSSLNTNNDYEQVDFNRTHKLEFKPAAKIITKPIPIYNGVNLSMTISHVFILMYNWRYKIIDDTYIIMYGDNIYNIQKTDNVNEANIYLYLYSTLNGDKRFLINS